MFDKIEYKGFIIEDFSMDIHYNGKYIGHIADYVVTHNGYYCGHRDSIRKAKYFITKLTRYLWRV